MIHPLYKSVYIIPATDMSKTSLKKTLNSLTRDQIMEVVLDLYEARKEAREYLEYFISPDERGMAEKNNSDNKQRVFAHQRESQSAHIGMPTCNQGLYPAPPLFPPDSQRKITLHRGNHKVFDTIEMVDKRVFEKHCPICFGTRWNIAFPTTLSTRCIHR